MAKNTTIALFAFALLMSAFTYHVGYQSGLVAIMPKRLAIDSPQVYEYQSVISINDEDVKISPRWEITCLYVDGKSHTIRPNWENADCRPK